MTTEQQPETRVVCRWCGRDLEGAGGIHMDGTRDYWRHSISRTIHCTERHPFIETATPITIVRCPECGGDEWVAAGSGTSLGGVEEDVGEPCLRCSTSIVPGWVRKEG